MIRCDADTARRTLALYDMRVRGGYKNQIIAEREHVRRVTGLTVRELRRYLKDLA